MSLIIIKAKEGICKMKIAEEGIKEELKATRPPTGGV